MSYYEPNKHQIRNSYHTINHSTANYSVSPPPPTSCSSPSLPPPAFLSFPLWPPSLTPATPSSASAPDTPPRGLLRSLPLARLKSLLPLPPPPPLLLMTLSRRPPEAANRSAACVRTWRASSGVYSLSASLSPWYSAGTREEKEKNISVNYGFYHVEWT